MRGKVAYSCAGALMSGITPAHAGKRHSYMSRKATSLDHPRTCGEKHWLVPPVLRPFGSPPHMRGKADTVSKKGLRPGITPAHAGKRPACVARLCIVRDHPRTCGEKKRIGSLFWRVLGSPPHMRGKGMDRAPLLCAGGITPAHAGKSFLQTESSDCIRDHPRTCGEKMGKGTVWRPHRGSPPHMRGKAPNSPFTPRPLGITLAHAGKRLYQDGALVAQGDHPRTCGEKINTESMI